MTRQAINCRALLSSTHQRKDTLTNIIDIPAHSAQEGGGASKGHFTVGGGFHLHIAALCVLASQPWWVSNSGVWIITIQRAGAVAAHGALDVIWSNHKTKTYSVSTKMIVKDLEWWHQYWNLNRYLSQERRMAMKL